jgi:hypothetical protein
MRSIFISFILFVYQLHYIEIKVSIDATVYFEQGKAIKGDFKPGSVERSVDLNKEDDLNCSRHFSTADSQ